MLFRSIYDITGAGSGNAPRLVFGNAAVFGEDIGSGDGLAKPYLIVTIPTTFTTGSGATLSIAIQSAIDNGANAPGTYITLAQTQAFAAAQLTAGSIILLPIPPVPPVASGQRLPRFYRADYIVGTGTFTAGAVTAYIGINPTTFGEIGQYPENYIAAY